MFDKFEWIVSRYEELSEAIVQPEIIQDPAKYQACLKERAALDGWWKVVAPSPELRKWFAHDPEKFEEFRVLYTAELDENPEAAKYREKINSMLKGGNVTLLYGAKDPEHNHAIVLAEWLMH